MTEYLSSENLTEKAYDLSRVLSNTQSTWPSSKLNPVSTKSKVAYSNHSTAVFQEQGNFQGNYRERPLWGMFGSFLQDDLVNVTVEKLDNVLFKTCALVFISINMCFDVFSWLSLTTRIICTLWHVLFVSVLIRVPLFLFLSTLYMAFFLNVSKRFLFVADLSEQSSASRSKEQLPSPSGTNL